MRAWVEPCIVVARSGSKRKARGGRVRNRFRRTCKKRQKQKETKDKKAEGVLTPASVL